MRRFVTVVTLFVLCLLPLQSFAQDKIMAAVAANFIEPFKEIAAAFEIREHIQVEPTISSTGKLYAQILEGAPYDVFLSADEQRPGQLFEKGMALKPFIYARGRVVLWSSRKDLCSSGDWKTAVMRADVKKIALANIETAPYGTAAMMALKSAGLNDALKDKLVFPQDVAQAFQYASTGSVDAGFCALSSALSSKGKDGCRMDIKEAPLVVQSACVLVRTTHKAAADKFAAFLDSAEAEIIKRKYGYQ
ncbi:MAG TPA: molybdate ABC transporter substrate-binding protein [Desulfomonilia bacterium]|nr:molybdate ABC transporter substrate-binding protein [Desulfomonilia bacterium]